MVKLISENTSSAKLIPNQRSEFSLIKRGTIQLCCKNMLRKFCSHRFELFSADRSIKASLYNVRPLQRQRGVCICSQNTNIPRSHERKQASTNQKDSYDHLYCWWQFSAIPVIWDSGQYPLKKKTGINKLNSAEVSIVKYLFRQKNATVGAPWTDNKH